MEGVTTHHTSDSGLDIRHLYDGSLNPLRSSPFSLWAMEVSTDRQSEQYVNQEVVADSRTLAILEHPLHDTETVPVTNSVRSVKSQLKVGLDYNY
ncbi:hypothetical protein HAX54_008508 [Datura stramonium]|uniref:Uncharacterized protein n=1 Tax=Datura stramonium TaxID=4076 RepID=A0ABS8TG29_DATST|nr:hypothetical protein [Datura stramonium]